MLAIIRRLLFGRPLETARQKHERLPKFLALPVFASDAISSNAYATEEILVAFLAAQLGAQAWHLALPVTIAIVMLLWTVVVSYRLTIFSYPHGGGSYIVTKENRGTIFGLIAAASLLTDYVLTVAVSISSGIAAFVSANPQFINDKVLLALAAVGIVALANLRGLRESGLMFAIPTYSFVFGVGVMIVVGCYHIANGTVHPLNAHFGETTKDLAKPLFYFWVLRGFSSGCTAMTGTEAVADGIPAFKAPESKNAANTLMIMASILSVLFIGISYLAKYYHPIPYDGNVPSVLSQLAEGVFGRGKFYMFIQYATMLILILAANTAYQDFPRLSSILARDRFAPRQLSSIGDRLVFTNGILALSFFAGLLIVVFKAEVSALIPLYAVGVFISFTLSQWSMSKRLARLKQKNWRLTSWISRIGAFVTLIVAVVMAVIKFAEGPPIPVYRWHIPTGAWLALAVISITVFVLRKIHNHYITLGNQLRLTEPQIPKPVKSTAIVLTAGMHKGILQALEYARTLSHDCRALYVEVDAVDTPLIRDKWEDYGLGVPLVILESPYRSVIGPVLAYLEEVKKERPDYVVTVVIPEFVPVKWWHSVLHNQSALMLKVALMFRKDIVVTNVRYYLER